MANVQLERGYTKIANELLERMALTKLSPIQYRLIFVIWRYTYGFNRKEHALSQSFLNTATGYDIRQIRRELQKLEQRNIIHQRISTGRTRIIKFNKNYDEWQHDDGEGYSTPGKVTPGREGSSTPGTPGNPTPQEIKNLNKNLNKKEDEETSVKRILDLLQKSEILSDKQITQFLREDINDVIENFGFLEPEQLIEEAIKDSARGNGKTWKYVYKKLVDWRKQGVRTVADLEPEKGVASAKANKPRKGHAKVTRNAEDSITGGQVGWIGRNKNI